MDKQCPFGKWHQNGAPKGPDLQTAKRCPKGAALVPLAVLNVLPNYRPFGVKCALCFAIPCNLNDVLLSHGACLPVCLPACLPLYPGPVPQDLATCSYKPSSDSLDSGMVLG